MLLQVVGRSTQYLGRDERSQFAAEMRHHYVSAALILAWAPALRADYLGRSLGRREVSFSDPTCRHDKERTVPKSVMIDQLYIQLFVPEDLPERECRAIARALQSPRLHKALAAAFTSVVRRLSALTHVRVKLTR